MENPIILTSKKNLKDSESTIYSDEGRIRQVLINLIDNAIKFTDKGYVEFGYEVSQQGIISFYVKDTGIGIAKKKQKIIFNRFVQAHESHLNKYGGTGLGLSIAKGIVELLGGEISLESEKNRGTTFYFTIPS
jgi:signal transduction histidine kinase